MHNHPLHELYVRLRAWWRHRRGGRRQSLAGSPWCARLHHRDGTRSRLLSITMASPRVANYRSQHRRSQSSDDTRPQPQPTKINLPLTCNCHICCPNGIMASDNIGYGHLMHRTVIVLSTVAFLALTASAWVTAPEP